MARSDKVEFRREFTLTNNGYVGDSEGFFVGDILSLHVDILGSNTSYLLQGKVGRTGEWTTVKSGSNERHIKNIDIREYEFIRLEVVRINSPTKIILFGYPENVLQESIIATPTENTDRMNIESVCELREIKQELKKLNDYMSIITGDKL